MTTAAPNERLHQFAGFLSFISGWSSFVLWSVSFYPQPLLNWKRRSTDGVSLDFPTANVLGLSAYAIYTGILLFSPVVQEEYARRHPKTPVPSVRANDFFYGLHGALLTAITYSQFYPRLWGFRTDLHQHASRMMKALLVAGAAAIAAIVCAMHMHEGLQSRQFRGPILLDTAYALSDYKLFTTVIKYCPQVWINYRRKSTMGFSIWGILLDFTGGIAMLLQLFIDGAVDDDWGSVTGNPAKFFLGNITLLFDICFMFQHYVSYGDASKMDKMVPDDRGGREAHEEDRLIPSRE